jgi:hypothetical protein
MIAARLSSSPAAAVPDLAFKRKLTGGGSFSSDRAEACDVAFSVGIGSQLNIHSDCGGIDSDKRGQRIPNWGPYEHTKVTSPTTAAPVLFVAELLYRIDGSRSL